jgi:hypothetical protein
LTTPLDDLVELEPDAHPLRFHSEGGSFSHYGPLMYVPEGAEAVVGNVTAHELNHYWMHSSTPYGAVLDDLAELAARETILYCVSLHREGLPIPIPAVDVCRAFREQRLSSEQFALLRSLAEKHVVPWTHEVLLENWFEGRDLNSVRNANLPKLLRWLIDFEDRSRAIRSDEELFSEKPPEFSDYQRRFVLLWADALETEERPAFPSIGLETGSVPLGAQHLFEVCAQQMEQVDEAFWDGASLQLKNLYWGLLGAVMQHYPGNVESEAGMRSVISTLMTIADLALFVPVGRVYGRLREDSMNPRDLHPGWRFEVLLDKLSSEDWLEGIDERAPRLQQRLRERAGWPSSDRFLELGAGLVPTNHDDARHAAACRMRLDASDRLIAGPGFDAARLEPLLRDHYPIFIKGSETIVGGTNTGEKLRPLMSYSLASFAWMVMRKGELSWQKLFPPRLDFTGLFENISSCEELIALYREIDPFYPDEAFCGADELYPRESPKSA